MKKKNAWIKSLAVSAVVIALMASAGTFLLAGEEELPLTGSVVEAGSYSSNSQLNASVSLNSTNAPTAPSVNSNSSVAAAPSVASNSSVAAAPSVASNSSVAAAPSAASNSSAPVDHSAMENSAVPVQSDAAGSASALAQTVPTTGSAATTSAAPVETPAEAPALAPAVASAPAASSPAAAPVSYSYGASRNYTFRMVVTVSNAGTDVSKNVSVLVPLLENSSPYQSTSLRSVNYPVASSAGRVSTFNIGDLAPGESKSIIADFDVNVRTISINSSNETVELARLAFDEHKGNGNCRDLALAFINRCRELGVNAREVIGFARPQRGVMTSGSLQGTRHSWAEFYVDGLGWVPADLTFQYFGSFPETSHIVESYGDESLKVNYTGGSLSASWSNEIL